MSSERFWEYLYHFTPKHRVCADRTVFFTLTPDGDDILPQPLTLCNVIMYQLEGRHSTLPSELFDTEVVPNAPS
jgi:hypothetical protein